MTTKTKLSSIALVAAAFTSATLIAGNGALAKPGFGSRHAVTINNSGNGTGNTARVAAVGFKRAALVSRFATNGAPTLPGCTSQAGCRTAGGGYLNGPHPVGGPEGGGNSSSTGGTVIRAPGAPGATAGSGLPTAHTCAEDCGPGGVRKPHPQPPLGDPGGNHGVGGGGGLDGEEGMRCGADDCVFRQD
jgi:hypothetical protein